MTFWCVALFLVILMAGGATAATITVPTDEPTIQAAINNATAGDTIFVESGTYNENVEVNKTLVLTGNMTGWNYPIIDGGDYGSTVNITAEDVVFEHFNVTGSSSDYMGGGCDYGAGIRAVADNATIIDNIVWGNCYGISLNGSEESWVYDNWVHDNLDHGIFLGDASNNDVTWNNVSVNGGNGIMVNFNSTGNLVADNDVSYNSYMGIRLRWASYNIIRDNTLTEDYGYGDLRIQEDCWYNTVTGNTIIDAYYHGIRIEDNCSYNQVTENTVLGCDRPGIMLKNDCDYNTVTGNYINDTGSGPGIAVYDSNDNLVAENDIGFADNEGGIYVYDESMRNVIRDNYIHDSTSYGIQVNYNCAGNEVLDNIIENSEDYGIYVYSSAGSSFARNYINGSQIHGIYLCDAADNNLFTDNIVTNSIEDGVLIETSDGNRFLNTTAVDNKIGFELVDADENMINGGLLDNRKYGVLAGDFCDDNVFSNFVTEFHNAYGIYLNGAPGSRVTGVIARDNGKSGIKVGGGSDNSQIRDNEFSGNAEYGIELRGTTDTVTFRQNQILDNDLGGIYLWDGPSYCIFYDNFFNNTFNAVFEDASKLRHHAWNLTDWTTGPNIIGGPLLGGNFWATPAGDGWSETHIDSDHDGFCDDAYNIEDAHWDHFPLHAPYADFTQSGRSGVAPYTVTFTDASGLGGVAADYYNWTFGDGSGVIFQTATSIQHTYTVPGIYDVTLFVTNMYGNDTVVKTDWIYVYQEGYGTGGGGSGAGGQTDFSGSGPIRSNSEGSTLMETVVEASDGIGKLTIPAGTKALDKNGNPVGDIGMVPLADIPKEPEGLFSFAGYAWQCTPAGATFDPPITMTLSFTDAEWAALDPGLMTLEWYNPATGLWETIPVVIDPVSHTVTAQISHFSVFALFEAAEEVIIIEEEGEVVIVEEMPTTAAPTTVPPTTQSPLAFAPLLALGAIPFLLRRK